MAAWNPETETLGDAPGEVEAEAAPAAPADEGRPSGGRRAARSAAKEASDRRGLFGDSGSSSSSAVPDEQNAHDDDPGELY